VLLAQAVANLLDNALKYAPGGGEILVEAETRPGDGIAIAVADRGPGIPADERARATERFFRGAGSKGTAGVGLGLSMVAAIARLHGGELRLEDNEPGLRAVLIIPPRSATRTEEVGRQAETSSGTQARAS
jgi:signal transduction histidine kinase